jgi:hypothetical protein
MEVAAAEIPQRRKRGKYYLQKLVVQLPLMLAALKQINFKRFC